MCMSSSAVNKDIIVNEIVHELKNMKGAHLLSKIPGIIPSFSCPLCGKDTPDMRNGEEFDLTSPLTLDEALRAMPLEQLEYELILRIDFVVTLGKVYGKVYTADGILPCEDPLKTHYVDHDAGDTCAYDERSESSEPDNDIIADSYDLGHHVAYNTVKTSCVKPKITLFDREVSADEFPEPNIKIPSKGLKHITIPTLDHLHVDKNSPETFVSGNNYTLEDDVLDFDPESESIEELGDITYHYASTQTSSAALVDHYTNPEFIRFAFAREEDSDETSILDEFTESGPLKTISLIEYHQRKSKEILKTTKPKVVPKTITPKPKAPQKPRSSKKLPANYPSVISMFSRQK